MQDYMKHNSLLPCIPALFAVAALSSCEYDYWDNGVPAAPPLYNMSNGSYTSNSNYSSGNTSYGYSNGGYVGDYPTHRDRHVPQHHQPRHDSKPIPPQPQPAPLRAKEHPRPPRDRVEQHPRVDFKRGDAPKRPEIKRDSAPKGSDACPDMQTARKDHPAPKPKSDNPSQEDKPAPRP